MERFVCHRERRITRAVEKLTVELESERFVFDDKISRDP